MKKFINLRTGLILAVLIFGLTLIATDRLSAQGGCAPLGKLETQITPEAQLAGLACDYRRYQRIDSLHVKVTIKNVSGYEQRFRVNIFFDNGRAVGGLIPRKTNKGLIKPGETAFFTFPVKGMNKPTQSTLLIIKTIDPL